MNLEGVFITFPIYFRRTFLQYALRTPTFKNNHSIEENLTKEKSNLNLTSKKKAMIQNLTTVFECVGRVLQSLAPFEFSARIWMFYKRSDVLFKASLYAIFEFSLVLLDIFVLSLTEIMFQCFVKDNKRNKLYMEHLNYRDT